MSAATLEATPPRGVGPTAAATVHLQRPRPGTYAAWRRGFGVLCLALLILPACRASDPPEAVTLQADYEPALEATVYPPEGWVLDERVTDRGDPHWLWLSPTGNTAYGVIRFATPVPVGRDRFGHEAAFRLGYLPGMRKEENRADVLDKSWDDERAVLRFEVEGDFHTVDGLMLIRGWRGWGVYAGTNTGGVRDDAEIALAEEAREKTVTDAER